MSVQRQIDRLIAYQAAEWFESLKNEAEPPPAGFVGWISDSPRHMEAFLSIASEAQAIRAAFARGSFDREALLKSATLQVAQLPAPTTRSQVVERIRSSVRRWPLALAATLAAVAVVVAVRFSGVPAQRFETPVGEQRTVQLAEGSVVTLNAQSLVEVRFDAAQRDIRLLRGEALFKVAKDQARPFRVHTLGAVVQATGTEFNVYAHPDGTTTVAVVEGKVRIATDEAPYAQLRLRNGAARPPAVSAALAAGEEARIESSGRIELNAHPNVADAVAWRQRRLVFKHAALEDMAAEFNRYNSSLKIRLEGIPRGAFYYTGAFDADDPLSLAALLDRESDLSVQKRHGEILIEPRHGDAPGTDSEPDGSR